MKLRFRGNSLRLRLNRREVEALASGRAIEERITFPVSDLTYTLEPTSRNDPQASFEQNTIRILAPNAEIARWSSDESIGLYYDLPTAGAPLRIMIEKDLECIDGPPEERDPEAFARSIPKSC